MKYGISIRLSAEDVAGDAVNSVGHKLLNILFPETCPVCEGPSTDHKTAPICHICWESITPYQGPQCRKCGKPLRSDASILCGECIQDEPAFSSVGIFGLYDGPLRKAVNLFKYHNIKRLSRPLAGLILGMNISPHDTVVPVPLHENRLRKREFNQSALLAKQVAGNIGASFISDCLLKTKETPPQVGLTSLERRKNMKNAFRVREKSLVQDKNILLIDDVITTGTTVRECSKVLKKAGADTIHVIALAHGITS